MSEKILFVDDEPAILDGYRRLLRGDYEIDTANGGTVALEMLEKEKYAVIIADMRMPEIDGAQLLAKIAVKYPSVMRIMLTGNSDMQTAVRAVNEGAVFRFLTKPCDKENLRNTINAALVQYRLSGLKQEDLGTAAPKPRTDKKKGDPALVEIEEQVRKIGLQIGQHPATLDCGSNIRGQNHLARPELYCAERRWNRRDCPSQKSPRPSPGNRRQRQD